MPTENQIAVSVLWRIFRTTDILLLDTTLDYSLIAHHIASADYLHRHAAPIIFYVDFPVDDMRIKSATKERINGADCDPDP